LTQRELARRAGTAQSVIARIESGSADPGWETVRRMLKHAGFNLQVSLIPAAPHRSHMLSDVPRIMSLTPEQRLIELRNAARFFQVAKRGRR
jgi:predicted transcriptional regulator